MSPLVGFLILIVSLTALVTIYLTKRFQEENIFYSKNFELNNTRFKLKKVEKEKIVAQILNGKFAMIGLTASLGAYLSTGQIILGFV